MGEGDKSMEYEFHGAKDVVTNLDVWLHVFPRCQKKRIWKITGIALVWLIWRMINPIVFHRESLDEKSCFDLAW